MPDYEKMLIVYKKEQEKLREMLNLGAGYNRNHLTDEEREILDECILESDCNMELFALFTDEANFEAFANIVDSMKSEAFKWNNS